MAGAVFAGDAQRLESRGEEQADVPSSGLHGLRGARGFSARDVREEATVQHP